VWKKNNNKKKQVCIMFIFLYSDLSLFFYMIFFLPESNYLEVALKALEGRNMKALKMRTSLVWAA
jgi:tryptophan-rich sensory protein